jgi:hypothetical protein
MLISDNNSTCRDTVSPFDFVHESSPKPPVDWNVEEKEKWEGLVLDGSDVEVSETIPVRVDPDPVGNVEGYSSTGQLYVSEVIAVRQAW